MGRGAVQGTEYDARSWEAVNQIEMERKRKRVMVVGPLIAADPAPLTWGIGLGLDRLGALLDSF